MLDLGPREMYPANRHVIYEQSAHWRVTGGQEPRHQSVGVDTLLYSRAKCSSTRHADVTTLNAVRNQDWSLDTGKFYD